jgi:hypothetical protein
MPDRHPVAPFGSEAGDLRQRATPVGAITGSDLDGTL